MYKIVIFSILSLTATLLKAQTGTIKHHASGYVNTEESVEQTLELDWLTPPESEVSKGLLTYTAVVTLKWEVRSTQPRAQPTEHCHPLSEK